MSEAIQRGVPLLIPTHNRLVCGDGQTTDTARIPDCVSVVETQQLTVNGDIDVVATRNDELDPLFLFIPLGEVGVDQSFKGVALLGCTSLFFGDS